MTPQDDPKFIDDEDESSTVEPEPMGDEEERDEVQEVKKMSAGDTNRVRMWRFVVTGCLVATAVAVTLTTYRSLKDEQQQNFEVAVSRSAGLGLSGPRLISHLRFSLSSV